MGSTACDRDGGAMLTASCGVRDAAPVPLNAVDDVDAPVVFTCAALLRLDGGVDEEGMLVAGELNVCAGTRMFSNVRGMMPATHHKQCGAVR